ncbi:MAG: MinD/ParA family protein [Phycisphaerales bacterium]
MDQATQLRELAQRRGGGSAAAPPDPIPAARPRSPLPGATAATHLAAPEPPPRRLARAIAVTSGKGGVGKSNLSVGLAIGFARRGLKTCLLDADLGMANADVLCGLSPEHTLESVVRGARRLSEVVMPAPGGFFLIPGASGVGRIANLQVAEQRRLVEQLRLLERTVDMVVIDTGAGVGSGVMTFAAAAGITLVAVTPEPTSMTDAYGAIKVLASEVPDTRIRLVVNMATSPAEAREVHDRIDRVSRRFLGKGVEFAGAIPLDPNLPQAVRKQQPLAVLNPQSPAAAAVDGIAAKLASEIDAGERAAAANEPLEGAGFLQRLAGWIRRGH